MTSLAQAFESIQEDLDEFEVDFMEEFAIQVQNKTPVDSGRLKNGWYVNGMGLLSDVEYWQYVEFGTRHNAPVGMVRRTVAESQSIADTVSNRVGKMK